MSILTLVKEVEFEKGMSPRFILDSDKVDIYYPITYEAYPIVEFDEVDWIDDIYENIVETLQETTGLSLDEIEKSLDKLASFVLEKVHKIEETLGFAVNAITLPIESLQIGGEF